MTDGWQRTDFNPVTTLHPRLRVVRYATGPANQSHELGRGLELTHEQTEVQEASR